MVVIPLDFSGNNTIIEVDIPEGFAALFEEFVAELDQAIKARVKGHPDFEAVDSSSCTMFKGCIMECLKPTQAIFSKVKKNETVCRTCFNERSLCVRYRKDRAQFCFVAPPAVSRQGTTNGV